MSLAFFLDDEEYDSPAIWDAVTIAEARACKRPLPGIAYPPQKVEKLESTEATYESRISSEGAIIELPPSPHIHSENNSSKRARVLTNVGDLHGRGQVSLVPFGKSRPESARTLRDHRGKFEPNQSNGHYLGKTYATRHHHIHDGSSREAYPAQQQTVQNRGLQERQMQAGRPMVEFGIAPEYACMPSNTCGQNPRLGWLVQDENKEVVTKDSALAQNSSWMDHVASANAFRYSHEAALQILDKSDYMLLQGRTFIKKNGWRKMACFFGVSFEIREKNIAFDPHGQVQRADFTVRALLPNGRFADGFGSCDRGEKRYSKPNNDVPAIAETRAKNRACQDVIGVGDYKVQD